MKAVNGNLILFKHDGYQVQLSSTNQVVLFHPRHPVCWSEFPELGYNDRVQLTSWDWIPAAVEEKVRALLMKLQSVPRLPRSAALQREALANPYGEPGLDYVKNWEEFIATNRKQKTADEEQVI